jgi:hypothetical protein
MLTYEKKNSKTISKNVEDLRKEILEKYDLKEYN